MPPPQCRSRDRLDRSAFRRMGHGEFAGQLARLRRNCVCVLTTGTSFVVRNATTSIDVVSVPAFALVGCAAVEVDATLTSWLTESSDAGASTATASVATLMNAAATPTSVREVAG